MYISLWTFFLWFHAILLPFIDIVRAVYEVPHNIPLSCDTDFEISFIAHRYYAESGYFCSLDAITVEAVAIPFNRSTSKVTCTFTATLLHFLGLCEAVLDDGYATVEFALFPQGWSVLHFPSVEINLFRQPSNLSVFPNTLAPNHAGYIYIFGSYFPKLGGYKVRFNETVLNSRQFNSTLMIARTFVGEPNTTFCITVAVDGEHYVPLDCSLLFTFADENVPVPPPIPDPFSPTDISTVITTSTTSTPSPSTPSPSSPTPNAPVPESHMSEWAREHWWVFVVAVVSLGIIIIAIFCVPRKSADREQGYMPLSSIDPRVIVPIHELKLGTVIGHGSFASVHTAVWRGTTVAVKKLHPHIRESSQNDFMREAALMTNLRHPNIVALMGVGQAKDSIWIVTEFLDRGSLDDLLLNANVFIEPEHIRLFAFDAAKGMTYLHAAGVIHRDLKCGNLLVDRAWNVKVADFGLSRDDSSDATMTACGTPSFAAPEVIRHQKYTLKADVFSFGICLWEMATREKPYTDVPPYQGMRPRLSPKIYKSFMRLMVQCWSENASARPSFAEITQILQEMHCPIPSHEFPYDSSESSPRSRSMSLSRSDPTSATSNTNSNITTTTTTDSDSATKSTTTPASIGASSETPTESSSDEAHKVARSPRKKKEKKFGRFSAYAVPPPTLGTGASDIASAVVAPLSGLNTLSEEDERNGEGFVTADIVIPIVNFDESKRATSAIPPAFRDRKLDLARADDISIELDDELLSPSNPSSPSSSSNAFKISL